MIGTARHRTAPHNTPRHFTAQHDTARYNTPRHRTAQHATALHCTPLHCTARRATSQHDTTDTNEADEEEMMATIDEKIQAFMQDKEAVDELLSKSEEMKEAILAINDDDKVFGFALAEAVVDYIRQSAVPGRETRMLLGLFRTASEMLCHAIRDSENDSDKAS